MFHFLKYFLFLLWWKRPHTGTAFIHNTLFLYEKNLSKNKRELFFKYLKQFQFILKHVYKNSLKINCDRMIGMLLFQSINLIYLKVKKRASKLANFTFDYENNKKKILENILFLFFCN